MGIAVAAAAVLAIPFLAAGSNKPEIAVGTVENAMGTNQYTPFMRACSETVLVELGRQRGAFRIVESPVRASERPDYVLQQRWVLWTGNPELVLVARDRAGRTVWSSAIYGAQGQFPAKISDKVGQFAAFARSRSTSS
jgi:hypothetical protein